VIVFAIALSPLFVKSKTAISRESYIFIIKFLLYFLVRRILVIFGLFDRLFVAEDLGKQESPTLKKKHEEKERRYVRRRRKESERGTPKSVNCVYF